jgi:DNA-binding transcriptional MerR regulator
MEDPRWNLDELAERVDAALAVDYRGQPSGRVRAVPDRRAIRWYTTIGLIDRPVAYRGRTALYGPRHLLQLVAVKRLQAKGLPLVAIQQELAGATDSQLAQVAHLPAGTAPSPAPAVTAGDGGSRPPRATAGIEPAAGPAEAGGSRTSGSAAERTAARTATGVPRVARAAARRSGFWRQQPAAALAAFTEGTRAGDSTVPLGPDAAAVHADSPVLTGPHVSGDPTASVAIAHPNASADPGRTDTGAGGIATLQGIRLGEGATLLLEPGRELDAADVRAILDAAGPLLSALRERGFAGTAGTPPPPLPPPTPALPPPTPIPTPPPPASPSSPRPPRRRTGGNEPRREQP